MKLAEVRTEIDRIDEALLELLSKRLDLAKAAGDHKRRYGLAIKDKKREEEVIARAINKGLEKGLPATLTKIIFMALVKGCRMAQKDYR